MTTITVGDLKTRFSDILKKVQQGESIAIAFGRKKEVLAYIVPKSSLDQHAPRPLGLLADTAGFSMRDDFKMTEEELLAS